MGPTSFLPSLPHCPPILVTCFSSPTKLGNMILIALQASISSSSPIKALPLHSPLSSCVIALQAVLVALQAVLVALQVVLITLQAVLVTLQVVLFALQAVLIALQVVLVALQAVLVALQAVLVSFQASSSPPRSSLPVKVPSSPMKLPSYSPLNLVQNFLRFVAIGVSLGILWIKQVIRCFLVKF
ncbi:hypothetical protein F2Q69_00022288 [Brassica cretica]|uniref:Transmembrane protein n=1 Tax=Brassica cretica TaxID=69181 RepID=A0A8S9Q623_BRACR|nr:hypothetical protein F2Q69_00022288 [Brassica cretica]